jgi:hypothetical protein
MSISQFFYLITNEVDTGNKVSRFILSDLKKGKNQPSKDPKRKEKDEPK